MKNKVDPEIPLVKVSPNNGALENGSAMRVKKRRGSGQFTISSSKNASENAKDETDEDKSLLKKNFELFLSSAPGRLKEEKNKDSRASGKSASLNEDDATRTAFSKWKDFVSTRRCKTEKLQNFEEINLKQLHKSTLCKRHGINDECYGFLEEPEEIVDKFKYGKNKSFRRKHANRKSLVSYFIQLASYDDDQAHVDLKFVEDLLEAGADVSMGDKHGQTVLHEVARIWHPDVAQFLIEKGAEVDKADNYGRTPLHVAAAVDYPEMVNFLISKQANIHAKTTGERQSPIHYAAKNDACGSLAALLERGASIDDRDYKGRTPLHIAAELDRSETCKVLLHEGAPAGVWDDSGMSAMALMILKMPPVALKALDQFHVKDRANRKQYFYLNYLETPISPPSNAKSCLKVAVEEKQFAIIMHPVMQRLTETKWKMFGKSRACMDLAFNMFFCIVWTVLMCSIPPDFKNLYSPMPQQSYRIVLEVIAVFSVVYWFAAEVREYRMSLRERNAYLSWRENEITRDIDYSHPRWPEERRYLEREISELEEVKPSYFVDWWNWFDILTYGFIIATIISHIVSLQTATERSIDTERAIGSMMLIMQWARLMKFVRAFHALGPFVVILRHVISDTGRFAFLFFEFYIPYAAALWILFGTKSVSGYADIEELLFNLLQLTVIGDYGYSDLAKSDGRMARVLCSTYIVLSGIVCLNLFIALLSDTFQRVYDNARANAQMLRAARVLNFEDNFGKERREKFKRHIEMKCAPEVLYYDDDMNDQSDAEIKRMTHQIKQDLDKMNKYLLDKFGEPEENVMKNSEHVPNENRVRNNVLDLAREMDMLRSNYEHSMRIVNIQLLSMNSMLAELTKRKKKKRVKKDVKPSAVAMTEGGRKMSRVAPISRVVDASEKEENE